MLGGKFLMPDRDVLQLLDERRFKEQPWLAKQLAGQAQAPGSLEERADSLLLLSKMPFKKQVVAISACTDRDELVEHLLDRGELGAVLNLLHSDIARWLPDVSEFSDLKWLLDELLQVKKQSAGKKARVVLHAPSGSQMWESAALLEVLLEDALGAAAAAWVRCLGGPGGGHQVLEIPLAFSDRELAEAIISELAQDPRALTLLLEDVNLRSEDVGLSPEEFAVFLQRAAETARYCHDMILTVLNGLESK